jgi:hypothetical protein
MDRSWLSLRSLYFQRGKRSEIGVLEAGKGNERIQLLEVRELADCHRDGPELVAGEVPMKKVEQLSKKVEQLSKNAKEEWKKRIYSTGRFVS